MNETLTIFRENARQARGYMPAQPETARARLATAEEAFARLAPEDQLTYSDELVYAREVVGGDARALADSQAGATVAAATAATVASENAKASAAGAAIEGFGEGLQEGASRLASGLDFVGRYSGVLAALALASVAALVYVYGRARA